jgi:hypothetical protein
MLDITFFSSKLSISRHLFGNLALTLSAQLSFQNVIRIRALINLSESVGGYRQQLSAIVGHIIVNLLTLREQIVNAFTVKGAMKFVNAQRKTDYRPIEIVNA